MWAGFFASAQAALNSRALLNIDGWVSPVASTCLWAVSHSAFYKYAQPMLEYMCDVLNEKATGGQATGSRPADLPYNHRALQADTRLSNSEGRAFAEALRGLKVQEAPAEHLLNTCRCACRTQAARLASTVSTHWPRPLIS